MAVEAPHPNFIDNRQLVDGHLNIYGGLTETFRPVYGSAIPESFPTKPPPLHAESSLKYTLPVSRKRTRDSIHQFHSTPQNQIQNQNHLTPCTDSLSFLGEDVSLHIQYQQFEIENFIAQHMEKIRSDIEQQVKPNARRIIAAVEEGIVKKLRAREEEIDRLGKLNWALEEKVKSLYIENQIWRDMAQTNEATVAALRTNLEQLLSNVHHRAGVTDAAAEDFADDEQSSCGSNTEENATYNYGGGGENDDNIGVKNNGGGWCRNCGKVESCVLLLPCRHLCLCTVCGSSIHVCPVCKSSKNASLHVNMSSS